MKVMLTGASGFVGSLLLPRLVRAGHEVVALTRDPARLQHVPEGVVVAQGDAISGAGLEQAMRGVDVAYYLIHSMEHAPAGLDFTARERMSAESFASRARSAKVERIVYLGGLVPRWDGEGRPPRHGSRHLQSREQVEQTLMAAVPGSIALRASIVIGAGSRSFRLMVRLVERMPVLALPAWQRFRTQPIDERDVTEMLLACLQADLPGRVLEIGGPDVLSYGEMLGRIAEAMLVGRPTLRLGVNMTPLAGRLAAAIAQEQPELVLPLMEGLQGDLLPREDDADRLLGVRLHTFDSAVEHALAEWERTEPLAAR
jgi:uncharacterized protein YbjT (DUF2867 family)